MDDIDGVAADWAVRNHRGLTPQERLALEEWLGADRRRRGAYIRACAAWMAVARAAPDAVGTPQRYPTRRLLLAAGGVALAAGLAGILAAPLLSGTRYSTEIGDIRRVGLEDGTVVALNTDSAIITDYSPDLRQIRLAAGEAWFDVAHDSARPLVVAAGPYRVRAVGTAFSVRHRVGGIVDIVISDGIVETWDSRNEARRRRLVAGQSIRLGDGATPADPVAVPPREMARQLSWREGMLVFDGETIAGAVAEMNRYNRRQLVVEDRALAKEKVLGTFRATDPEGFARAVSSLMRAEMQADADKIRLRRRS